MTSREQTVLQNSDPKNLTVFPPIGSTVTIYSSYTYDDYLCNHNLQQISQDDLSGDMHTHDICELLFLKKGNVSYNVEGRVYQLSKNCLVISRPLDCHSIYFENPTEYERYNILFDEKKLASDIYSRIPPSVDVINFDGNTLVCDLFRKFEYYGENFEGDELQVMLMHLTEEILYNVLLSSKTLEPRDMYTVSPLINKAIKYIDSNITTPLGIDTICEELYITKSHLHHLFIKHLQISPKQYILSKKLAMAQRELRSGSKPTDVYLTCGFTDYSTFYRDYKKHFGYAPSDEANVKIIREIRS